MSNELLFTGLNVCESLENNNWENILTWPKEKQLELLKMYHIFSKNEGKIFALIYDNHEDDAWEDMFRDYDQEYIEDKAIGVEIALNNLQDRLVSEEDSSFYSSSEEHDESSHDSDSDSDETLSMVDEENENTLQQ